VNSKVNGRAPSGALGQTRITPHLPSKRPESAAAEALADISPKRSNIRRGILLLADNGAWRRPRATGRNVAVTGDLSEIGRATAARTDDFPANPVSKRSLGAECASKAPNNSASGYAGKLDARSIGCGNGTRNDGRDNSTLLRLLAGAAPQTRMQPVRSVQRPPPV
jgi:hypothetical protein